VHRFFVPALGAPGDLVMLSADEAAHLTRVLRLRPGAPIVLVDGRGGARAATVEAVRPEVRARIGEPIAPAPEPRVPVTLASAVLKGDVFDQIVRDAVMLGVSAIRPVISTRTELSHATLARGRRADRWARIAVASMKQCGRAVLPAIAPPVDLRALLDAPREGARLMLVEPQARGGDRVPLATLAAQPVPAAATLLVGPEGGWTPEEVEAARERGWTLLALGGRTLRAETAPMVALTALWTIWGEL
jgi:16S rRNA (uracil1498-N3)-methyltransferase